MASSLMIQQNSSVLKMQLLVQLGKQFLALEDQKRYEP